MKWTRIAQALVVVLLAAAGPACASILGDDFSIDGEGGPGVTSGGSFCDDQGDCDSCFACARGNECAGPDQACFQDADCAAIDDCIFFNCDPADSACAQSCGSQFPAGIPTFNNRAACLQAACPCSCGGGCS